MPAKAGIRALPAMPHTCSRRGTRQNSVLSIEQKQAFLFCEQKRSKKNFDSRGLRHTRAHARTNQKFFASFFQKRSASFPPQPASAMLSPAIGSRSRD
jgi:hypothetical protein